ncbi:hypothetical protein NPIL_161651 [Nephila pilipes]|uniref:Uncharacterized protein n=1 Tax=Nephila pilipes TaxID=299642 RepID=A0A8X6IDE8_NEPPI|nr:hypothetical protein NPIL_161651 [Nephila pilipes]
MQHETPTPMYATYNQIYGPCDFYKGAYGHLTAKGSSRERGVPPRIEEAKNIQRYKTLLHDNKSEKDTEAEGSNPNAIDVTFQPLSSRTGKLGEGTQ